MESKEKARARKDRKNLRAKKRRAEKMSGAYVPPTHGEPDPTPDEIAERAAEIRRGWSRVKTANTEGDGSCTTPGIRVIGSGQRWNGRKSL